jgi:prevent-host-death family protein
MKTVSVVRLKAELSRYVRLVEGGDEILVTERGVAVAKLVPITKGRDDLERHGLIRLGSGRLPRDFWNLPCGRDPRGAVLKALLEERESG